MFGNFNQRPVLEIIVNGIIIQPGQPVNEVKSLMVNHSNGLNVQQGQGKQIMDWLWNIVQKCENNYISYNGVLILKEDVKKYKEK